MAWWWVRAWSESSLRVLTGLELNGSSRLGGAGTVLFCAGAAMVRGMM